MANLQNVKPISITLEGIFTVYTMSLTGSVGDNYAGNVSDPLKEIYRRMSLERERLRALQNINREGTCTRDIMSFIGNQTKLRSVNKQLDKKTTKAAMRSKITDVKSALALCIKDKNVAAKRYLGGVQNNKFKLRKALGKIKKEIQPSMNKLREKNDKKTHVYSGFLTQT